MFYLITDDDYYEPELSENIYPLTLNYGVWLAETVLIIVEPYYGKTNYTMQIEIGKDYTFPIVVTGILIMVGVVAVFIVKRLRG